MKKRPKSPAPLAAEPEPLDRVAWVLPAMLFAGFFYYPVKSWPMENLGLCAVMGLAAAAGGIGFTWAGGRWRALWLSKIGRLPVIAGAALSLYALTRWSAMDVGSFGTEWVLAVLWMTVAMALGTAAATAADAAAPGGSINLILYLRRFMIAVAIAAALHGIYQYAYGWERTLAAIGNDPARYGGVVDKGVEFALQERRISGRLGDPNLFATQLAMLAAFCIGSIGRGEKRGWRIAGGAGWLALAAALVLSGSRGGMLTFAAVTLAGLAAIGGTWRGNKFISNVFIVFLILLTITPACAGLLERLGNISTVRERLFYWTIAAKIWAMHPIVGGGPGRFALMYAGLKSPMARESQQAHSWLMQAGADLGIVGAGLEILLWGAVAWMAWKAFVDGRRGRLPHSSQPRIPEYFWPLLAVTALSFNGLFEFAIQWRAFLVPAGLLIGLAGGAEKKIPESGRGSDLPGWFASILCGCALAAAAALSPAWHLALRCEWDAREAIGDAKHAYDHGRLDEASQAVKDAATAFETAAKWQPRDAEFVLNQARQYLALGKPEEASTLLDRAAKLNPYSAAVRATQARLLIDQNRLAPALAKIDEALGLYPSNLEYRMIKIGLLVRLGRDAEARDLLESIERDRLPMYSEDRAALDDMRLKLGMKPVGPPKSDS